MKTFALIFVLLALPLAACQQEVVYHDSSLSKQFAEFGQRDPRWQITGVNQASKPRAPADPNAHVVKEADFSGMQFHTNFQVDDPRFPELMQKQNDNPMPASQPATPQPGMNPFGATPVTTGH
jgi:hypothetical protein